MRVVRAVLVVLLAAGGTLWTAPSATGGPLDRVVAVGEVRYETTSGRYHLPTFTSFRFTGSFSSGAEVVTGQVRGSGAVLDTATLTFHPIELRRPDGRVAGTCSASLPGSIDGFGVQEDFTLSCTVRVGSSPPRPATILVHGVARSTSGDGIYDIQRTVHEGVFASS